MIMSTRMVPLFTHPDFEISKQVLDAAYRAGVRVFEYTNRGPNAYDVFKELAVHVQQYPDMALGIGTILDVANTDKFLDAGAAFIVSPIMNPEMAEPCERAGVMWMPGCATLTEMFNATNAGAEIVKLFPGSAFGPKFVSAVMPVIPTLKIMATGGVEPTAENLTAWFKSGVTCVGMGSQLFPKELIQNKDWKELEEKIANALAIIKSITK